MTRNEIDLQLSDDAALAVEVSDKASATACGALMRKSPTECAAPYRGEFRQRRNVYDGNGQYEFPTARHYVP